MGAKSLKQIEDIVNSIDEDEGTREYVEAARTFQSFSFEEFEKKKTTGPVTHQFNWRFLTGSVDSTVKSGLFDEDATSRNDLVSVANTTYGMIKNHYLVDVREPEMMSDDSHTIVPYIAMQDAARLDRFYEYMDSKIWTQTGDQTPDSEGFFDIWGIPYFVRQDNTGGNEEFDFRGGDGLTHFGIQRNKKGLMNGTFQYTAITNDDFCKKLSTALDKSYFRPPVPHANESKVTQASQCLYSSYRPWQDYQDLLYVSNDNIGTDMGKYRGGTPGAEATTQYFRGIPWYWLPALTNQELSTGEANPARDLREPIYGINKNRLKFQTYGSLWGKRTPVSLTNAHNIHAVWYDYAAQLYCTGFRDHFVGSCTVASAE